ncbi:hypothetical protein BDV12DRAFT_180435 [Aspergillus spectabilis]
MGPESQRRPPRNKRGHPRKSTTPANDHPARRKGGSGETTPRATSGYGRRDGRPGRLPSGLPR